MALNSHTSQASSAIFSSHIVAFDTNDRWSKGLRVLYKVDFLHRTVREFLQARAGGQLLAKYVDGAFNTRQFRYNALAADLISLSPDRTSGPIFQLRSLYFVSFLDQSHICNCQEGYWSTFEKLIPFLHLDNAALWGFAMTVLIRNGPDVLRDASDYWKEEQSTALSLGIQLGWTKYVKSRITSDLLRQKEARPLLDYALRPRHCKSGKPQHDMVRNLLEVGADPSDSYR